MKNKCNKIEQTCGTSTHAACVEYEGEVNEVSPLSDDCALSIQETTQDIYTQLEEINLSELGETCLEYILDPNDKIIVKNVLLKLEQEICLLKEQIEVLQNTAICEADLSACDLDFGDLVTQCATPATTMKEVLQLILDTIQPTP